MLGVVDTVLVAGLGAVALAGIGTALQVIFVLIAALSALSVGASVQVAQAFGAGDLPAASRFARQALVWSAIVSVPLALLGMLLTPTVIGLFGLPADVAQVAQDYLHITIATIVTLIMTLIGGGVLRGVGDSRTPMLITALANLINVGLAYALIYGHFGLPALGAVGSAWAPSSRGWWVRCCWSACCGGGATACASAGRDCGGRGRAWPGRCWGSACLQRWRSYW